MFWNWLLRYSSFLVTGVVSLIVGLLLERLTRRRPDLIYYFSHVQVVKLNNPAPAAGQPAQVDIATISLFLWNQGKAPAREVHVGHNVLPAHSVYPDIPREENPLPGGGGGVAMRFPIFPARTLVTITYLVAGPFPQNFIQYVGSEDGAGKRIPVMLQRIWPKWWIEAFRILLFAGIWVAVNAVWSLIKVLWLVYYR